MKKLGSLTLSLALTAALSVPVLASDLLIVPISAPVKYGSAITVNGVELDTAALPAVEAGYIPMRLVAESDHGSASWYQEENSSFFYMSDFNVTVHYEDNRITAEEETLPGSAVVKEGVTFLPISVLNGVEGYTVTEAEDKIDIVTPNNAPLIKLSYQIIDEMDMASTFKQSAQELKEYFQMDTGMYDEISAFSSMMIRSDALFIGKVTNLSDVAKAEKEFEARRAAIQSSFEQYLPGPLELAKNGKVVSNGTYVMMVISENNDRAIEIFNAYVADQT